jgi:histidinol-phosphate aminotransferase
VNSPKIDCVIAGSPRLDAIPRYEPGLTSAEVAARYGLSTVVKLASNESPYGPLPEVAQAIATAATGLNRYPDGAARALRATLADLHGVDIGQVIIGNGSGELILMAGQALLDPGATVVYAEPSFALYSHLASASGAEGIAVGLDESGTHDLDAMAVAVDERTRLVVICNPNNPTGTYIDAERLTGFLAGLPEDLPVLVDEAYYDFVTSPDRGRMMSLARERPNLLVTRTFSKAHGLPGLRVGYGIGGPGWVDALNRVRPPFNSNSLAQVAALEALRRLSTLETRVRETVSERARVAEALGNMKLAFTPSHGNFILVQPDAEHEAGQEASLHERLLRRGVIVRNGASLGVPGRMRVSIGTPDENNAFLAALAAEMA